MELVDYAILVVGWLVGNITFNNFEKHLPLWRRILKLFIIVVVFSLVGVLLDRKAFYGLLLLLTAGQVVLHAWWFPKHGINGLTAEPYARYLELIRHVKRDPV